MISLYRDIELLVPTAIKVARSTRIRTKKDIVVNPLEYTTYISGSPSARSIARLPIKCYILKDLVSI